VLSAMERWIWKQYHDGMPLHTYVLCRDVLGMYPRATHVVGIPIMTMMNQKAMVPWASIYYGISIGR
jgi:hypothetical protein